MGKHRTLEEKIEIVRFKEQGHSISQVASEFGISHSTVCEFYKSRDEIRAKYYAGMRRQDGCYITVDVEVIPDELMPRKVSAEDLKKENKALREENEYLKDKVAYLEALYEVIKQDPASVIKKKIFRNREGLGIGQEERQEAVRDRRRVTKVLLPEPQTEEERRRGCSPT